MLSWMENMILQSCPEFQDGLNAFHQASNPIYPPADVQHGFECWESFHAQHAKGRFFKERRYLMLEFPQLNVTNPPQYFTEIGCGCGSSILPVLRSNPSCMCTACDISESALQVLREAGNKLGIDEDRLETIIMDASVDPEKAHLPIGGTFADCVLLIFTLSALPPEGMANMIQHASFSLNPNGLILFRDYGLCDMTQLRYKASQKQGENLYRRLDGTLAYYFSKEYLVNLMQSQGFQAVECDYVCVIWKNRKNGKELKRVFVHGIFQKMG